MDKDMDKNADLFQRYVANISESKLSIHDHIDVGDPNLWIPSRELESLLTQGLRGMSVYGLPIRRRSKTVKEVICRILGYPTPKSFRKTKPRFPGQNFDTYIQKSNNLQIWNEEIDPTRRYVVIQITSEDIVKRVRVITGVDLASLDTTGTLTRKYQARATIGESTTELITPLDTDNLQQMLRQIDVPAPSQWGPIDYPTSDSLLPISHVFEKLFPLVGSTFANSGHDQERIRGDLLHNMVCERLGYSFFRDDGRFPDVRNQLLEVKLQTSSTIDLGFVRPDSNSPLDIPMIKDRQIRHCDVRYAVFYGKVHDGYITLTNLILTTGEGFFNRFPQFMGMVSNAKLQIHLPNDFFNG